MKLKNKPAAVCGCAVMLTLSAIFFPINAGAMEAAAIVNGLAVYKAGEGEPIFLMPYPHASVTEPMADTELAKILIGMGRSVITFDPPGMFESSREPLVTMEEMLACTNETLRFFKLEEPIDMIGHSMGSFCALAYSIEYQEKIKKLVLIGSTSGWPAVNKWGVHVYLKENSGDYRRFMIKGFRMFIGLGNLKIHKEIDRIIAYASYVNKSYVPEIIIGEKDRRLPPPARAAWPRYLRKSNLDYRDRLSTIALPVLIVAGRHDPQTPVVMNEELRGLIPDSRLEIFENSGHSPFIEEEGQFRRVLQNFLAEK